MGMRGMLALLLLASAARAAQPFTFASRSDNDLFVALAAAGERHARYETPAEAVKRAAAGSAVLVLADRYPDAATSVDAKFYEAAKTKRLRLYVEFPALVPGVELSAPKRAVWERGIVASDRFGGRWRHGRHRGVSLHQGDFSLVSVSQIRLSRRPALAVIPAQAGRWIHI